MRPKAKHVLSTFSVIDVKDYRSRNALLNMRSASSVGGTVRRTYLKCAKKAKYPQCKIGGRVDFMPDGGFFVFFFT